MRKNTVGGITLSSPLSLFSLFSLAPLAQTFPSCPPCSLCSPCPLAQQKLMSMIYYTFSPLLCVAYMHFIHVVHVINVIIHVHFYSRSCLCVVVSAHHIQACHIFYIHSILLPCPAYGRKSHAQSELLKHTRSML